MTSSRSVLRGLVFAGSWGVLFEILLLGLGSAGTSPALTSASRLARVAEVALAAALASIPLAVLLAALPGRVRSLRRDPGVLLAASGFAFCACLTLVVVVWAPRFEDLRLTTDPILGRPWAWGVGGLLLPVVAAGALSFRAALPRRARRPLAGVQLAVTVVSCGALSLLPSKAGKTEDRPDVFLFSVDTLRADHLGCYGYPNGTSPALDRLCAESIVFDGAMAPAPSTIPSYTSIMTGLLQKDHGVYSNYHKADDALVTVAERLADHGYATAAVIEGSFPGTFANLGQGFDTVIQRGVIARSPTWGLAEALRSLRSALRSMAAERWRWDVSVTTEVARRWMLELPPEAPVFVHFYWPYPHDPYAPPSRYLDLVVPADEDPEIRGEVHRYDAEIRFTDVQLDRLLQTLEQTGRHRSGWIVFTADHGEELGRLVPGPSGGTERYFGHSRYLYDSSLQVPLLVRPPDGSGLAPGRRRAIVSTASIATTILRIAGVEGDDSRMLPQLPLEDDGPPEAYAFSVARSPVKPLDIVSIRTRDWRLIETRLPEPGLELYRYDEQDQREEAVEADPEVTRSLLERLHAWDPPGNSTPAGAETLNLSDRERERLEALGYLM